MPLYATGVGGIFFNALHGSCPDWQGSSQEVSKISRVESGRIRRCSKSFEFSRVGSGRVGSGRVGSGRVGSGRVGSGRVGSVGSGQEVVKSYGSDHPDAIRPARSDPPGENT